MDYNKYRYLGFIEPEYEGVLLPVTHKWIRILDLRYGGVLLRWLWNYLHDKDIYKVCQTLQIKQKWGYSRWYVDYSSRLTRFIIDLAEKDINNTCFKCGSKGTVRNPYGFVCKNCNV